MGFIGSWVTYDYWKNGWEVYGLDNRSSYGERLYDKANLSKIMADEYLGDIVDASHWTPWLSKINPQLIVHLAGQAIVPRAFSEPCLTFRTNALGTLTVLEAARQQLSVKAVLCVTSDKVYENNNDGRPFVETDALGGGDIYSVSKSSSEMISRAYKIAHIGDRDLSIQTVRLGNVVGGGDWSKNRLLPDLIYAMAHEKEFRVRYMKATRPFQNVADVVKGISLIAASALDKGVPSGEAWNLGPKDNTFASVHDVIELFKKDYPNLMVIDELHRNKEDLNLCVSVEKYSTRFVSPRDTSLESLERTLRWYKAFDAGMDLVELIQSDLY